MSTDVVASPHPPIARTGMTTDQVDLIRRTLAAGATDDELALFIGHCNRTGLDPFARQIYLVPRKSQVNGVWVEVHQTMVSIDGARLIAQRDSNYRGQTPTEWCADDGVWKDAWLSNDPPVAARVAVIHADYPDRPVWGIARYGAYVQTIKDGSPNTFWRRMPDVMLAKCFDEQTEILTTNGFEPLAAVTGRVLMVSEEGLIPTDAVPFQQQYDGEMVVLDSDDLNFAVTPRHDMITTTGKIPAGELYDRSRSRPVFRIPRAIPTSRPESMISDDLITLAAAYLADGADGPRGTIRIAVARDRKVATLDALGLHRLRIETGVPKPIVTSHRTITPTLARVEFVYDRSLVADLVGIGKVTNTATLMLLSQRQARVFVDALISFDGTTTPSGTRRFYTSRVDHAGMFELAAVAAGYAVSVRRARTSDLSDRPNYNLSISGRDDIPVVRWSANSKRTGIRVERNQTDRVWCVTVPSGVIVVRRKGFSMLCGNCAEMLAMRKAFQQDLSGLVIEEESGVDPVLLDAGGEIATTSTQPLPRMKATRDEEKLFVDAARAAGLTKGEVSRILDEHGEGSKPPWSDQIPAILEAIEQHGTDDIGAVTEPEEPAEVVTDAETLL